MKNTDNKSASETLRQKAEDELKKRFNARPDNHTVNSLDPELLKYIHELEVHQIELKMQNEEILQAGILRDITQLRENEIELEESKEKYRGLSEAAFESIFISERGICIEQNQTAEKIFGYTSEEAIGRYGTEWIAPQDREMVMQNMLKGHEDPYEAMALKKDGSTFPCILRGKMMHYKGRTVRVTSLSDNTYLKQAEEKLKASEQLYRNLFDQANEGLILLTMDGKIAEVNQSFAAMHGFTVDELKNTRINDLDVLRENAFEGRAEVMRRINAGEVVRFEVEHYHKDGHSFILCDTASLITIGNQQFYLAFHQDITDRKRAEEQLLVSESTLKESQKLAGLGTFDLDIHTGILSTSHILKEIFGIDEKYDHSLNGWTALLHPDDREKVLNHLMNEVIGNMQPGNIAFRFVRLNDKTTRWMHALGKLEFDADCLPIKVHGTAQDITEQKQFESELVKAKEKAEESDRLKSAFLANISHEIRTPMNAILGFSNLLKEPHLSDEEQQEYIKLIDIGSKRMLNIIHDIVDISKIESRQMEVLIIDTNVNEKIELVYNLYKPEASQKGIQIFYKNALQKNEAVIQTDREKLNAILSNLVVNAIQYTNEGSIEFGYEKKGETLEFFVKDTGIGVPEQYKELIFERFRQGNDLTRKFTEGTGLGLSISKAYIELLGGKMWLESEVGKGSTFYFTLPYKVQGVQPHVKSVDLIKMQ